MQNTQTKTSLITSDDLKTIGISNIKQRLFDERGRERDEREKERERLDLKHCVDVCSFASSTSICKSIIKIVVDGK